MHRYSEDFSKRLSHYGIAKVGHDHIHITSPITWDEKNCPFNVTTVKTKDLDKLKRLFGVPNSEIADVEPSDKHKYLAALPALLSDEDIYEAASAYVYGNSNLLTHHKAAIENKLGVREVQVASANTMTVSSVMTMSGITAIVVDNLVFEPGGQLLNVGVLSINAGQIQNITA